MPRILVSPLDWGLGHATRCVPVIRYLREKGVDVVIGSDGRPGELLKQEFPDLQHIALPGYGIHYPENSSAALAVAVSIRKILKGIKEENKQLHKISQTLKLDAVISDNRYGLYHPDIPSVFMTHQITIKAPFVENLLYLENKHRMSDFTECWIPDVAGAENLSGDLAHSRKIPEHCSFIGPLSRFSVAIPKTGPLAYHLLFLISGPEDQRSVFEVFLKSQVKAFSQMLAGKKVAFVLGVTEKRMEVRVSEGVDSFTHLPAREMQELIAGSGLIISRSGYSTIMDLAVMGRKAIFIPTPGQTEQEYLARKFRKERIFYSEKQSKFRLDKALLESEKYTGLTRPYSGEEFKPVVDRFLARL